MNRYGQTLIGWGTVNAPQIFTGICTQYDLRDAATKQLIDDMGGDFVASIIHSRKASLEFAAKVTSGSTNWLDLSAGAQIAVPGITTGTVLCARAVETWRLSNPKTTSLSATSYPAMVPVGSPTLAGVDGNAFTPSQSGLSILSPGSSIIYGTFGLTHAAGIIHGLTLTQTLEITEDDVSPAGDILGAALHGYQRTLQMDLLAKAAAPAVGSSFALATGATAMMANFEVESVDIKYQDKRGVMYAVNAFWIPPFTS